MGQSARAQPKILPALAALLCLATVLLGPKSLAQTSPSATAPAATIASSPRWDIAATYDRAAASIARSYRRAPVAVSVAAAGLTLPLVGVLIMLARGLVRFGRRLSARSANQLLSAEAGEALLPSRAWLEVAEPARRDVTLAAELHRIGRDADNDLTITGPGVAATHVLIRRTSEREYLAIDVSGTGDAGLTVNGLHCASARLANGDELGVGPARVTFHDERALRRVAADLIPDVRLT